MQNVQKHIRADWLYQYKKKIIVGILLILAVSIVLTMAFIAVTLRTGCCRQQGEDRGTRRSDPIKPQPSDAPAEP